MSRPGVAPALRIWIASRAATVLLTIVGGVAIDGRDVSFREFLRRWFVWDAQIFENIARFGYFSGKFADANAHAFFPGQPLLVRAAQLFTGDWTLAGLVVSAVAGGFGAVAVWRLAAAEGGRSAGSAAVLALVTMPYAVFLFAGYSEPVFLAFAAWAWLAAQRGDWRVAGVLAAGAAFTRVTAVPLVLGLGVLYLTAGRGGRRIRPDAAWLLLPVATVAGWVVYLHARTGRWDAYSHALAEGWGRRTVSPLTAFRTTLDQALHSGQPANYVWSWWAEIVALLVGVALTAWLARGRRWGEAAYVGSNALVLSVSSFYASNVRALLVWFPLWTVLGGAFARRPGLQRGWLWVSAPLAAVVTVAFTRGAWVG